MVVITKEEIMNNYEFGKPITQVCKCCGKVIRSTMWNYGGSLEYIIHDNFAANIRIIFGRHPDGTIEDYGEEFIELTYDTSNKPQPNHLEEFIECFMHYNADEQLKKDIVDYVRVNYR